MTGNDGWDYDLYPGFKIKVIRVGNATVEIKRPLLTPEERARREEIVIQALRSFGRSANNG